MKNKSLLSLILLIPVLFSCKNNENEPHNNNPINPPDPVNPIDPVVETEWSTESQKIFKDYLYGYYLPYIDGASVNWDAETEAVIFNGGDVDLDGLNNYASLLENEGFAKEKGPYSNTFSLYKTVNFENKERTIEIDLFAAAYNGVICLDGVGTLTGVCYDPYIYEWPTNEINDYLNSLYKKPSLEIPSYNCNRYSLDTSNLDRGKLGIYCDALSNAAESTYTESLKKNGFSIGKERNNNGYLVAEDPEQTIRVLYQYSSATNVLGIMLEIGSGWPYEIIDGYVNQLTLNSGTKLPALIGADKYEVIEDSFDWYGYVFVRCNIQSDPTKEYEDLLESYGYTLYNESKNTASNYAAVSENKDLFVQYEFTDYGDKYSEFCILFEPYYEYNTEHVSQALQLVVPGTETMLPEYPGEGFKVNLSDNNNIATFTVQSSSYDALENYVEILSDNGWSVAKDTTKYWTYYGYSPTRDFKLDITLVNGYVTITLKGQNDPYKTWPTKEIKALVSSLGAKGTVPEIDNCLGFDVENNEYWHDIICFAKYGNESLIIDSYIDKITSLGYKAVKVNSLTYYEKSGETVAIRPYFELKGTILIDVIRFDNATYEIDYREEFESWKKEINSDDKAMFPGLNLSIEYSNVTLVKETNTIYKDCNLFQVKIDTNENVLSSSINEITKQFEDLNWIFNIQEQIFKNGIFSLKVYSFEQTIIIDVYSLTKDISVLGFTKSFVHDLGLDGYISLPSKMNISYSYDVEIDSYSIKDIDMYLYLTFSSSSNATTCYNEIIQSFKDAGWQEFKKGTNYLYLIDKTETLEIYIGKSGSYLDYNIYEYVHF